MSSAELFGFFAATAETEREDIREATLDGLDTAARKGNHGGRPPAFDKAQYRRRSAVERCVNKGKQFRAVASRYDKRDCIFNGTLTVAAIVIWLRDTVQEPSEAP